MAIEYPNKFVNSVSERAEREFDDEARKNKAAPENHGQERQFRFSGIE